MQVYCSKKHANTDSDRFCTQCGESLPLQQGKVIASRYKIIRQLGQGGFGRTYLAEDFQQSNEKCVLKEFAPQVENPQDIQKAKELFEREASVLKELQHPQIPKFHEFFQTSFGKTDFFFLVQDYVEGDTYWDLWDKRLNQGEKFSEKEVISLFEKMLPVLDYIHSKGAIHRDISPDNVILRSSDNLPVLIDFGGVKQVPASQGFWMTQLGGNVTLLGKKGYAPEEQLRQGKAFPCSDLHSLGVTGLVLLTGKEPQELYDSYQGSWRWSTEIRVSRNFEGILKKMVAYKPSDRYQNAENAIKELQKIGNQQIPNQKIPNQKTPNSSNPTSANQTTNPLITKMKTMIAAPAGRVAGSKFHQKTQMAIQALPLPIWMRPFAMTFVGTTVVVLVCAGTWGLFNAVVQGVSSIQLPSISLPSLPGTNSQPATGDSNPNSNPNSNRSKNVVVRRQELEVPEGFFNRTVNDIFYTKKPELQRRSLTGSSEDEPLRKEWASIGQDLLNKLEQEKFSKEVRERLGSYGGNDYEIWQKKAEAGDLGKYTIEQLNTDTNRKFDDLFPGVRRGKLNQQTYGQIWYAIAANQVGKLESGN
ncbi:serine/threonine-protein kinase [Brunnivagina elsteri]|uniref:non-specific serine/threonine protein kinase n=1 Tax=Brunnivagina elsteri CCALA 953 TaxID=987040 RepID=A0A2A2TH25_9CYAN|nr:serine/threonine-protein kinase [Calothrix elsteri]PAX53054.1 serine/threonine protein kinase [Calothrix elsteri CCALA 953]